MLSNVNPTQTKSWIRLKEHFNTIKHIHMKDMFKSNGKRFDEFSIQWQDILVDFSKNRIDSETLELLKSLAKEVDLSGAIEHQFNGEKINTTENRAVLHTALRNRSNSSVYFEDNDVMPQINSVLSRIKLFSEKVIDGSWKGYGNESITDIVNIGIGGSDLGPVMVTEALKPYKNHLNVHFISNIDASQLSEILTQVNPKTTLFIVASKSFKTLETMTNARTARNWFLESGGSENDIKKHFVAISTNWVEVEKFGIAQDNMFEFWDWVGGRYSLWSAIGLSIVLAVGFQNFEELLSGAHGMDKHFRSEKENSIPALLGLIGIWYNNFFEAQSHAILPYNQYLHRFAAYFQQGDMESNGKFIDRNGNKIDYQSGPIIWGEPGTNGQHAFYQLIHQGTKLIPCDFLAAAVSHNPVGDHHEKLLSNFFAQTKALMNGKNKSEVIAEFEEKGRSYHSYKDLIPFKQFDGNRPTNSILFKKLTPYNLGALVAMYEHKIFVQGHVLNINSYDQWGVELGKQLAKKILPNLSNEDRINQYDSSTNGLVNAFKEFRSA